MATSKPKSGISINIDAVDTLETIESTVLKYGSVADTADEALRNITKVVEDTVKGIGLEVETFSQVLEDVGKVLQDRTEAIPGLWLWAILGVLMGLILLMITCLLLIRTRTEIHNSPPSRFRKAVWKKIRKNRKQKKIASMGEKSLKYTQDFGDDPRTKYAKVDETSRSYPPEYYTQSRKRLRESENLNFAPNTYDQSGTFPRKITSPSMISNGSSSSMSLYYGGTCTTDV